MGTTSRYILFFPTAQTRIARNYGAVAKFLVWEQSQARKRVVYFVTVFVICGFFSKLLVTITSLTSLFQGRVVHIMPGISMQVLNLNMSFFADLVLSLMNVVHRSMQLLEERNKLVFEQSNCVKADPPPVFLLVILFTQVNSCAVIKMLAVPMSSFHCNSYICKLHFQYGSTSHTCTIALQLHDSFIC